MKGLTYFEWWGFSINEGTFPNIHISWGDKYTFIYICLTSKLRWAKNFNHNPFIVEKK